MFSNLHWKKKLVSNVYEFGYTNGYKNVYAYHYVSELHKVKFRFIPSPVHEDVIFSHLTQKFHNNMECGIQIM